MLRIHKKIISSGYPLWGLPHCEVLASAEKVVAYCDTLLSNHSQNP